MGMCNRGAYNMHLTSNRRSSLDVFLTKGDIARKLLRGKIGAERICGEFLQARRYAVFHHFLFCLSYGVLAEMEYGGRQHRACFAVFYGIDHML